MKKYLALLMILILVFSLAACSGDTDSTDSSASSTSAVDPNLIDWQDLPDPDIVGAWKDTATDTDDVILFTVESDVRMVRGSITLESDIKYGVDGNGIKSAYTQGNVLYGQWTYEIKDDTLTVRYPNDEKVFTYKAVDYTPVTLIADEEVNLDSDLIGEWANEEFMDSYTFDDRGYATYKMAFDDGVYVYDSEILYTYSTGYGEVTMSYIGDNTEKKEVTNTFEYSIDGDKLIIDGNDFTRVTDND